MEEYKQHLYVSGRRPVAAAAAKQKTPLSNGEEKISGGRGCNVRDGGNPMKVHWRTDADGVLAEAKEKKMPVLIDFSAAPA